MVVHDSLSKGGGYFLKWGGIGIVIDPGFNFIENFHSQGLRIQDIDYVFITHAHIDHCVELEAILTLLFEFNDTHDTDKKITLYLNLGAYKKYGDWLTSCQKKQIEKIHVIDSESNIIIKKGWPGYPIFVKPTKAMHSEIWDKNYCLGFIFTLCDKNNDIEHCIGLTGDTGWSNEIMWQYSGCDLLVLHIGGIKEKEIYRLGPVNESDRLYENHLGVLGTTLMLHNLMKPGAARVKLALISEFGEELKGVSTEIIGLINKSVEKHIFSESDKNEAEKKLNCIIGDVGTKVLFDKDEPYIQCEHRNCTERAERDEIVLKGGIIVHYCKKHTPSNPREELLKILDREI